LVNTRKLILEVQGLSRRKLRKRAARHSRLPVILTTSQFGTGKSVCRLSHKSLASQADSISDYEPLVPFTHTDHGKDADPKFPNLLQKAEVVDLTANIGAEVRGVQLSNLTKEGKDELALFVAQRKVVGKWESAIQLELC
jgi:hypothetical protein